MEFTNKNVSYIWKAGFWLNSIHAFRVSAGLDFGFLKSKSPAIINFQEMCMSVCPIVGSFLYFKKLLYVICLSKRLFPNSFPRYLPNKIIKHLTVKIWIKLIAVYNKQRSQEQNYENNCQTVKTLKPQSSVLKRMAKPKCYLLPKGDKRQS